MTKRKWPSAFSVLFMAALLGGCGGGQVAGGGTGGTGMVAVRGQVESTNTSDTKSGVKTLAGASSAGVSSIKINGVTYDMSAADYEGKAIEPGMVVTLVADNATTVRTAKSAFYIGELKGPVTEVLTDTSFELMGHTVYWDDRTSFSGPPQGNPSRNTWVEISGFSMDDGRVHATYITYADAAGPAEVLGYVTTLPDGSGTIEINKVLNVNHAESALNFDLSELQLQEILKIEGTYDSASGILNAEHIERLPNLGDLGTGDEEAEVEGLVSGAPLEIADGSTFFVAGQPVRFRNSDSFRTKVSGGLPVDISNGVHVEVEGALIRERNGPYFIEAEEIEFEDAIEIEARIEMYSDDVVSFFGTLVEVQLVDATQRDVTPATDLCVNVRARERNGSQLIASRIKSEDDCSKAEIQAPIKLVDRDAYSFDILNLTIDVRTIAKLTEEERLGELTVDEFLGRIKVGDIISLEGPASPGALPSWDEAEIEH